MKKSTSRRKPYLLILFFLQIFFICCSGQTVNIKDHLLLHIPFDGDNAESIKINNHGAQPFSFVPLMNNEIVRSTRIYARNDVLKIGSRKDSLILKKLSRFPISITFWMKVESVPTDLNIVLGRMSFGKYKFELRERRNNTGGNTLFTLKLTEPEKNETQAEWKLSTEQWQLFTIQIDERGQLKLAVSNTIIGPRGLSEVANPQISYSAPNLNVSDVFNSDKSADLIFQFRRVSGSRKIYIDDIRVYNKILSKEDLNAIANNDPYLGSYVGRYQIAYTYKQLADQYYLKASDINRTSDPLLIDSAKSYYLKAREAMLMWVDQSTTEGRALYVRLVNFQFTSDKDLEALTDELHRAENKIRNSIHISSYYDLLLFDINYRIRLLESGYTFWGKDFTEKPMFPVQEYQFFNDIYSKFNVTYQKIEALLKYQGELDEKQEMNELQSQLASHRSEIEKVKIDETQFKVGFYDQQLGNIDSRLKGIEERQKHLTREVERKEKALKELDAKIMSQVSSAISQATLGVSIDVTRDLKAQLTNAGLTYLAGDNELVTSLLGSYKDVYDVAITAREYYQKGKDVFETVKSVAAGKITIDNVLKIGDAVANSGFVDEDWAKEWDKMKSTYHDAEQQYKKGKEILEKVKMTAKNPNMKNIVDFVDWMAQSEYIPENYRKEFAQFKNYRQAAYSAVKDKRYDDLINLGLKMVNDPALTEEVKRIRARVQTLKPAFVILEMVKKQNYQGIKDVVIENILNGSIDAFANEQVKNDYLYRSLQRYLHLSAQGQTHFEAIFEILFNESPAATLECFPFDVKEDLMKLLQVSSYHELITRMETFKFSDFTREIKIMHDTLFIYGDPYVMGISKYLSLEKEATKAVVKLYRTYSALLDTLKNVSGPLDLYKIFEDVLLDKEKSKKIEQFFTVLNGKLNPTQQKQVIEESVAFYLGNGVFQAAVDSTVQNNLIDRIPDLVDPNNPNEVTGENMGSIPEGDNSAMMRQMAARALDMAFPGVGTAVNMILNIADAIFSGYQIVDELRGIYTEKIELNKEYVKLMDNYRDNQFNKQIALYETRISNISYDIMLEEHEGYSKMVNNITDRKHDVRRKIGGHLPLLLFYAERMRYYFQRLNKASVFWYGAGNSLNKIIFTDQNNIRLAIDPDIKLFDWITAPDVTSSREDLFRLFSYWSRIYALVTDGITGNRLKYGENVAEISYKVLDLEEVDPQQWKEFNRWKRHPNINFTYNLDLTYPLSSYNAYGFDSSYTSIKIIQVIPIAIDENNHRIQNVIAVSNMGLSVNEAGEIEPLVRKTRSSGDDFLEIGDNKSLVIPANYTTALRYRWDSPSHDYQPFNFEGYNLRSDWKITIDSKVDAKDIKKIYFVVFYQYAKDYGSLQQYAFPVEYLYKLKLPYNIISGASESLNVTLTANPLLQTPSEQFSSLLTKYPYLRGRVQNSDLKPYLSNNSAPLVSNNGASNSIRFTSKSQGEKDKKKCFLKNLFNF